MKRTYILLLLALLMAGCKTVVEEKPPMDDTTMVNFLIEAHLMENYYNININHHTTASDSLKRATYEALFDKFHIQKEDFEQSMDFYTHHEQQLEEIYMKVRDSLNVLYDQYDNHN